MRGSPCEARGRSLLFVLTSRPSCTSGERFPLPLLGRLNSARPLRVRGGEARDEQGRHAVRAYHRLSRHPGIGLGHELPPLLATFQFTQLSASRGGIEWYRNRIAARGGVAQQTGRASAVSAEHG